jgi:hypothetical protein
MLVPWWAVHCIHSFRKTRRVHSSAAASSFGGWVKCTHFSKDPTPAFISVLTPYLVELPLNSWPAKPWIRPRIKLRGLDIGTGGEGTGPPKANPGDVSSQWTLLFKIVNDLFIFTALLSFLPLPLICIKNKWMEEFYNPHPETIIIIKNDVKWLFTRKWFKFNWKYLQIQTMKPH